MITTIHSYLSLCLKQIFHSSQLTRYGVCKFFKGIIATSPLGILVLRALLLEVTLYHGNHDRVAMLVRDVV